MLNTKSHHLCIYVYKLNEKKKIYGALIDWNWITGCNWICTV